ncbi:MAG: CdaR family protein [Spirochaetales bacterium]
MSFRNFFENILINWQAKLLSFGIAILLYAAFQIISFDSKSFSVPLQEYQGGNFIATENFPSTVRVTVKGNTSEIATIQESDIIAYVDTSKVTKAGLTTLPVQADISGNLALIDSLDIEISPGNIECQFEEIAFAWAPVEAVFKGSVPDGYEMVSWQSDPQDVKIMGIKSIIDSVDVIYADGVDLNEQRESFSVPVELQAINAHVDILMSDTVSVAVKIAPQIINKSFTQVIPATTGLLPEFIFAELLPVIDIELSGEKIPLSLYSLSKNAVAIDCSQITAGGEYTLPVLIDIPEEFSLNTVIPREITVQVIRILEETGNTELNTLEEENLVSP